MCLRGRRGLSRCGRDLVAQQLRAHAVEHRADRVAVFGGLLRSDLLQLLALPFDVRGGAHLRLGVAAPFLHFLLPQHLGHGRADHLDDLLLLRFGEGFISHLLNFSFRVMLICLVFVSGFCYTVSRSVAVVFACHAHSIMEYVPLVKM